MKNCEKEKSTYSDEVTYTTYPQFIQFYRYICQVASAPLSTIAVCLSPNMLQMFHFHQNCLRHRIYLGAILPTYLFVLWTSVTEAEVERFSNYLFWRGRTL